MSPQLAAVERMMGIPGLPHLTAVLRVPQASHLQKPRRQKVRGWCFQEGAGAVSSVVWVLAFCQRLDIPTFHMDLRESGQSCSDP